MEAPSNRLLTQLNSARTTNKIITTIAPLPGVGQEYWQSLSYLPSAQRAGSDKIKANE